MSTGSSSTLQGHESPWPSAVDWYDLTLPTPAQNLALDEALLHSVDSDPSRGILRTWSPDSHFVVVGRSNQVETEVNTEQCQAEGIPVYRRSSGGGAVVVGPGCLAFALALPLSADLRASGVNAVTQAVMQRVARKLETHLPGIEVCGTSDLVISGKKFSGNSQRWLRQSFLHHGTLLHGFDLTVIERLLRSPSRQPEYRSGRSHGDFVTNIAVPPADLLASLVGAWNGVSAHCPDEIRLHAEQLAHSRYEQRSWNWER